MGRGFRTLRLDEIEPIDVAGVRWLPLRRTLGITAFGTNAYRADAGEHVVEAHDETGGGSGKHEELYVVLRGHARFTVAGEEIDAPGGTLVFVHDREVRREAVATEDGTIVLVAGGDAGSVKPSPWEHFFAAEPAYRAGDYAQAIEIASAGLADHPDNVSLNYQLACYHALAGDRGEALRFIRRAAESDAATVREWAAGDRDLDAIRDDPAFPA